MAWLGAVATATAGRLHLLEVLTDREGRGRRASTWRQETLQEVPEEHGHTGGQEVSPSPHLPP